MTMKMFKCPHCGDDVSRQGNYDLDQHGRMWHEACWADHKHKEHIKSQKEIAIKRESDYTDKVAQVARLSKKKYLQQKERSKWSAIRKRKRAKRWRKIINFLREI